MVVPMNPCSCGYFPDRNRCRCTPAMLNRYIGKISEPFIDRMDVCVQVPAVEYRELEGDSHEESSAEIMVRVKAAHAIQKERYKKEEFRFNSEIPSSRIKTYCNIGEKEQKYMEGIYEKLGLSARSYHKILKTARTIADLKGNETITLTELGEAVCYRGIDKKQWRNGL